MNRVFTLLLSQLVVVVSSCTNQIVEENYLVSAKAESASSQTRATVHQELQRLGELGYNVTTPVVTPEFYILEGKYKIRRGTVFSLCEQQSQNSNVILHPHYRKIGLNICGSVTQTQVDELSNAIYRWNSLGCDVQFGVLPNTFVYGSEEFPMVVKWEFDNSLTVNDNLVIVGGRLGRNDAPVSSVHININNRLWQMLTEELGVAHCFYHALARIAGFAVLEEFNGALSSIFHNPKFYDDYGFTLLDNIPPADNTHICNMYSTSDITPYTYNLTPSSLGATDSLNVVLLNKDYNLSLTNASGCCTNADIQMTISVYNEYGDDVTTDVTDDTTISAGESFTLNFSQIGRYNAVVKVYDSFIGSIVAIHTIEDINFEVKGNHFATETNEVLLNQPYNVTYNYWCPNHPNATIEYSIEEVLFKAYGLMPTAQLSYEDGMATVTLRQNGCYYVQAIVKDNNIPIDTAYCNITKLVRLPEAAHSITITKLDNSEVDPASVELNLKDDPLTLATYIAEEYNYEIDFSNVWGAGRFGCFVESEYENRNDFEIDYSIIRQVDVDNIQWFMRLHKVSTISANVANNTIFDLPTLYLLRNTEPNEMGYERSRYEYYTGYVHCPLDGIREVNDKKAYNLPMQTVVADKIGFNNERMGNDYEQ